MSYRTSHDLARVMGQSDDTARRVLRELWPRRDEPRDWRLDETDWEKVLYYLTRPKRRFGCRRRNTSGSKSRVMHDLSIF